MSCQKTFKSGRAFFEPKTRKRGKRFYIRFYDPSRTPRQIERSLHTTKADAAERTAEQLRWAYLNEVFDPWNERRAKDMTIGEAIREYLKDEHIRESTRKCKRHRLEPIARAHPNTLASGLTADILRSHCLRPDLNSGTRLRYLYECRKFLEFCSTRGWVTSNPAAVLLKEMPRHTKQVKRRVTEYLSTENVRRLLAAIDFDIEVHRRRAGRAVLKDVVLLAVATGLRRGELCNLKWADVELFDPPKRSRSGIQYGWLSIRHDGTRLTKTGHEDRVPLVPLSQSVLAGLRSERVPEGYVFTGPRGGKLDGEWISSLFREYRRLARLPDQFHFHSLRHTCASWLAENGTDLKVIQEVLRHSKINQTMRYAHLIPEAVAERMVAGFSGIEF